MNQRYLLKTAAMTAAAALITGTAHGQTYDGTEEPHTQTQQSEDLGTSPGTTDVETEAGVGTHDDPGMGAPGHDMGAPGHHMGEQPGLEQEAADAQAQQEGEMGDTIYTTTELTTVEVRQLQEELNAELDAGLVADGVMGPQTQAALRQYQEQNNLQVTGTLTEETVNELGLDIQAEAGERRPAGVETEQAEPEVETDVETQQELDPQIETQQEASPEIEYEQESATSEQLGEDAETN